jgi:hypothetical protein
LGHENARYRILRCLMAAMLACQPPRVVLLTVNYQLIFNRRFETSTGNLTIVWTTKRGNNSSRF